MLVFKTAASGILGSGADEVLYLVDATAGALTETFPDATLYTNCKIYLGKSDASVNAVNWNTTSSQTVLTALGSATTGSLTTQGARIGVVSDGANWAGIA